MKPKFSAVVLSRIKKTTNNVVDVDATKKTTVDNAISKTIIDVAKNNATVVGANNNTTIIDANNNTIIVDVAKKKKKTVVGATKKTTVVVDKKRQNTDDVVVVEKTTMESRKKLCKKPPKTNVMSTKQVEEFQKKRLCKKPTTTISASHEIKSVNDGTWLAVGKAGVEMAKETNLQPASVTPVAIVESLTQKDRESKQKRPKQASRKVAPQLTIVNDTPPIKKPKKLAVPPQMTLDSMPIETLEQHNSR